MSSALPKIDSPADRLTAAISILQVNYLAQDTNFYPETIFGTSFFMPDASLEHAIKLLIGLLPDVEGLKAATPD